MARFAVHIHRTKKCVTISKEFKFLMTGFTEDFIVEDQYLRVTTIGEYSFAELFDFISRVKTEVVKSGLDRVLIDSLQLEGAISEAERFQGGKQIAEVFGGRIKLAWLLPAGNITKLGELAAINRGAKFLVTSSESEALTWLLDQSNQRV